MTDAVDPDTWRRVLAAADGDPPPALAVEDVLVERDLAPAADRDEAYPLIHDALEAGTLVEVGEGFGGLRLADEPTDDEPAVRDDDSGPIVDSSEEGDLAGASDATTNYPARDVKATPASVETWDAVAFDAPQRDVWPPAHLDVDAWMIRKDSKAPWAPWADPDAPVVCSKAHDDHDGDETVTCADCRHSARYKWGSEGSREHVHADAATALEWRDKHPEARDDLVFIQSPDDPFAFVDGDDVRDPETGAVHPEFVDVLEALGVTYADVSTSDSGIHALYRGELPDGVNQATWELDTDPFGANDEPPAVEIYDSKHVCVATGRHLPQTGTRVEPWDDDALRGLLDEHDELPSRASAEEYEVFDADDHDPAATSSDETTSDIRDIYAALDRLDARRVADRTIAREWFDDSGEHRAFRPTWASSDYEGTAVFANSEVFKDSGRRGGKGGPACMAAIDAGLVVDTDCPDAVRGETWWKAVEHLRTLGFDIPEYVPSNDRSENDPLDADVILDPRRAWNAARAVTPTDLDDGDDLESTADGEAFRCPCCGDAVDIVRAVAADRGDAATCSEPLDDYARPYRLAREEYGAPLPRYLTTADAVGEYDTVLGAVRALDFFHLDPAAFVCDVTGDERAGDDVNGDAVVTLDPSPVDGWRDSDSGTSVVVYPSGTLYDADADDSDGGRGRAFDALRFVALDSGLIDDPGDPLGGGDFTEAYRLAREVYGAPLPRWHAAEAAEAVRERVPLLPDPEVLLGDGDALTPGGGGLEDAYEAVEALVAGATDPDRDADAPVVLKPVPGTGKTTGAIKRARDQPATYLAPRLELQEQALEKAERWGVSYDVLPVFGAEVRDEAVEQAVAHVREHGKEALRDRWQLVDVVDGPIIEDDDEDDDEVDTSAPFGLDHDGGDEVDLPRATCDTAAGEHGEAWALAVAVARELDHTPLEIHQQGTALFGAAPPCTCDHDHGDDEHGEHDDPPRCSYSRAWDRINDREDPADLLIGSYVHAHVEGVRTYRTGSPDDPVDEPRAVVLDEFPGEAFGTDYGAEAFDFATWLARALSDDVDAAADVTTALAADDWVTAWLEGDAADSFDAVSAAVEALDRRGAVLRAVDAAESILEEVDRDRLDAIDVRGPLARLVEAWRDGDGAVPAGVRSGVARDLDDAYRAIRAGDAALGVAHWVRDAVADPLREVAGGPLDVDLDGLPAPADGPLADVVRTALDMSGRRDDGARTVLDAAAIALRGGDDGARELALWADDGHAHPDAGHLLQAIITPTDDERATRVETAGLDYPAPADAGDGTVLKHVAVGGRTTVVVDENRGGATVLDPPERTTGGGDEAPLVGLDATARAELWGLALGEPVEVRDIHDGPRERAEFLRDELGISVVRVGNQARPYMGDPDGKDTDGDTALVEYLADEVAGVYGPRDREGVPVEVGNPAVVTAKGVEAVLGADDRLEGKVAASAHYGALDGRNDLGDHQLAALLGSPHYGDHYVEKLAALAGEGVDTDREAGRGMNLDYGSPIGNAALRGMREDRVMQAVLRFARGDSGAVVFARTAALRDDLPLRGRGEIAKTYTENATRIVEACRSLDLEDGEHTAADVEAALGDDAPSRRTIQRTLAELATAGYLERERDGPGTAWRYNNVTSPGAGEVDVDADLPTPDTLRKKEQYTVAVGVAPRDALLEDTDRRARGVETRLPAPGAVADGVAIDDDPPR